MQAWKTGLLAAAAALAIGGTAFAQEPPIKEPAEPAAPEAAEQVDDGGVDISFNIGAATDYVFRGISQTDEGGQIFAGADVTAPGGYYAGVWASNVDFAAFGDDDTNVEIDIYGGIKPEFAGYTFDFAAIYYAYLNQPETSAELGYFEAKAAVSRAVGPATLGGALYFSPEFTGEVGRALYYEVNGAYTINDRFSLSGAVGRQTFDELDDADYTTFNVGVTVAVTPNIGLDVRYWDTDEDDLVSPVQDIYEGRVVAGIKATF
jgi:uncharacterized protein (TIGR02001 family)